MNSRNVISAVAAVVATSTAGLAAAATLGGLDRDDFGADRSPMTACDTDGIDVGYTSAYSPTAGRYEVTAVNLSHIDAGCAGQTLTVTLAALDGAALAVAATVAVDAPDDSIPVPAGVAVSEVASVAVMLGP